MGGGGAGYTTVRDNAKKSIEQVKFYLVKRLMTINFKKYNELPKLFNQF